MKAKDYRISTFADGYGLWHAEIIFTPPVGNTGEAEKIKGNALRNAKRQIRQEIVLRMLPKKTRKLYYIVKDINLLPTNQLAGLTIREKLN